MYTFKNHSESARGLFNQLFSNIPLIQHCWKVEEVRTTKWAGFYCWAWPGSHQATSHAETCISADVTFSGASQPEPLTNSLLENLQIFWNFYISNAILSKTGSFNLMAPSIKTSCLPCRGPRVSTISLFISASMFWFFNRRSKTADLVWNLEYWKQVSI